MKLEKQCPECGEPHYDKTERCEDCISRELEREKDMEAWNRQLWEELES
jgi:uncharacterized OB-fold protein